MRKGDEKRQALLDAAEALFCRQGYAKTGVQEILDATGMSKGGFYHHFASKEEVLAALCSRRAERAAADTVEALNAADSPMGRIDAVLHGFMPLRREEAGFMSVLPIIDKPEGRALAITYQDALLKAFLPMLRQEVAAAAAVETVCPPVSGMEKLLLHTVNHCWMEAAAEMLTAQRNGCRLERSGLLRLLEKYRRAIEVLLDAPYGSIEIIRVEEWEDVAAILAR